MSNCRIYGKSPYRVALIHGGFILLDKCGHEPWIERHARDQFMNLISAHLQEIK